MSIKEQIRQIIAEALSVDITMITPDLGINDIPEWNSIGNLAIITAVEEKFGVEIPIDALFELTTVANIVSEIENLKNDDNRSFSSLDCY